MISTNPNADLCRLDKEKKKENKKNGQQVVCETVQRLFWKDKMVPYYTH